MSNWLVGLWETAQQLVSRRTRRPGLVLSRASDLQTGRRLPVSCGL